MSDSINVLAGASLKLLTGVLVGLALFLAGCVSETGLPESVDVQAALPTGPRSVVAQATPVRPEGIRNVGSLTDAPQLFAGYLKDALALKRPDWQIIVASQQGTLPERDMTVVTELLEVAGGSANLRFWIGLGT